MEGDTAIQSSIKDFVYTKIQEQVYIDVSRSDTISIKPRAKHGSTALAMFWLRVLRHESNYPMPKYPYKDVYNKEGINKVILTVDNVTITTLMKCGTLTMHGWWVLEWFVNIFPLIMQAYDAPVTKDGSRLNSTVYKQYTERWKKLKDEDRLRKEKSEADLNKRVEEALQICQQDKIDFVTHVDGQKLYQYSSLVKQEDTDEVRSCDKLREAAHKTTHELEQETELLDKYPSLWPEDAVTRELEKLRTCSRVRNGSTYVYSLWKSLLHTWFSDATRKVYIVSPLLDVQRLVDICHIILEHRVEANLEAIYVQQECDAKEKIFQVQKKALDTFSTQEQMYLEYKVCANIVYPMQTFGSKFIACIKDGEAEVLVTSANFHGNHFDHDSMETVSFHKMSEMDFLSHFLVPINASAHE